MKEPVVVSHIPLRLLSLQWAMPSHLSPVVMVAVAVMIPNILIEDGASRRVLLARCFVAFAPHPQALHIVQALGVLVVLWEEVFPSPRRLAVRVRIEEEGRDCRYSIAKCSFSYSYREGGKGSEGEECKGGKEGNIRSDQRHAPERFIISAHPRLRNTTPRLARTLLLQHMACADGPGKKRKAQRPEERDAAVQ